MSQMKNIERVNQIAKPTFGKKLSIHLDRREMIRELISKLMCGQIIDVKSRNRHSAGFDDRVVGSADEQTTAGSQRPSQSFQKSARLIGREMFKNFKGDR